MGMSHFGHDSIWPQSSQRTSEYPFLPTMKRTCSLLCSMFFAWLMTSGESDNWLCFFVLKVIIFTRGRASSLWSVSLFNRTYFPRRALKTDASEGQIEDRRTHFFSVNPRITAKSRAL